MTTIEAFESGVLDLKDFYFTGDDYPYKIEIEAKRRLLQLLKERFNSGVKYGSKTWNWDAVIQLKTQGLARFLLVGAKEFDLTAPRSNFGTEGQNELREKVLSLTAREARKIGINKNTLWYLQKRVESSRPLLIYGRVRDRIAHLE